MKRLRSILPNLKLLLAFEASARYESFTLAGKELNLSQSAVSYCIKTLEADLGVKLFERNNRSIRLTPDGVELQNSVVVALNHLVPICESIRAQNTRPRLRIATDVTMADLWLLPRLSGLRSALPDTTLDLTVSDYMTDLTEESIDCAIIHGDGTWPSYDKAFLFKEETMPVCSPSYLKANGPINSLDDLVKASLIDFKYEKWAWMNWTIWFAEMGLPNAVGNYVFQSNFFDGIMEYARNGHGVTLGWRHFVDDDLLSGRLVVPLNLSNKPDRGYYLIWPQSSNKTDAIERLRETIIHEVSVQRLFEI